MWINKGQTTISVQNVMSDALWGASCTRPSPTQPTLLTHWRRRNPVESVTCSIGDACCLAQLDGCCRVSLSVGIVRVRLLSPLLASSWQTVTLCSSTLQNVRVVLCILDYTITVVLRSIGHAVRIIIHNTQKPFHRKPHAFLIMYISQLWFWVL